MKPVLNVVLQRICETVHKFSSWRDYILVKFCICSVQGLITQLNLFRHLVKDFLFCCQLLFNLKRAFKPSASLLIHFGPGSDTIDGHVYESLRFGDSYNLVNILKDVVEHICL